MRLVLLRILPTAEDRPQQRQLGSLDRLGDQFMTRVINRQPPVHRQLRGCLHREDSSSVAATLNRNRLSSALGAGAISYIL